jgi:hypothetical protein
MAYEVVAYRVRYLADNAAGGLPGGIVTLSLPPSDVPAEPNVLLVDQVTVICSQGPQTSANLYDADPAHVTVAPIASTTQGNLDQGESANGIVIPSGGNLFIQWSAVVAGVICRARVQFRIARPVAGPPAKVFAHPILRG